jgi:hypothetical protein
VPALGRRAQGQSHVPLRRRAETIEAGEAYFAPPGHTPDLHAGTELVEFSPTAELERTLEVVMRNVEAMQAST